MGRQVGHVSALFLKRVKQSQIKTSEGTSPSATERMLVIGMICFTTSFEPHPTYFMALRSEHLKSVVQCTFN